MDMNWIDEIRDPEPRKRYIYNADDYDPQYGDPYYREHSTRADSRVSFVRPMASIQSIHFSMDSFQSSRGSTCSQLFLLSFQYLMGLLKRIEKGSDFFITSQGILLRVSGRCSSENQLQGEHAR